METTATLKHPRLAELAARLEPDSARAKSLAEGLSSAQLDWQPAPKSWGVGQCLEHLCLSAEQMMPLVRQRLAEARARQQPPDYGPWKTTFFGKFIRKAVDPDTPKKVRTSRNFNPSRARPDVLAAFLKTQEELQGLLREADGLSLSAKIASPATGLIRYTAGEALDITVIHVRRHLNQAERAWQQPGFPKA